MSDNDTDGWPNAILELVGALIVLAISWHVFFEIIHPVLMSISPAFAYNPDGRVGRAPDSPAQVALFATVGIGLYLYFSIQILFIKVLDEFIGCLMLSYLIFIVFSLGIIKNMILPKFRVDRWKEDFQDHG